MGELVASKRQGGYFTSYIKQRIGRNKNFICCCTGQTGSGKSWSMLALAEQLDPNMDERNICFTPLQLMDLVNGKSKQLKRGSVILFDEIQVSMGHLDYQSMQAKMLNYLLQTFRHRNFVLLVTSPHFHYVNKSARQLFHCRMETVTIDTNAKQVVLKPLLLQTNQSTGKVYAKYLRVATGEGAVPLKRLRVGLPSPELIAKYEMKKTEFTDSLNKEISEKLQADIDKKKPRLTKKQEEIVLHLIDGKKVEELAEELGINIRSLYQHIEAIERKGIRIRGVKEGGRVTHYEVTGYDP